MKQCPFCLEFVQYDSFICEFCGRAIGDIDQSARSTKRCPYCAEDIKIEAIVCRYCGRDLPQSQTTKSPKKDRSTIPKKPKKVWLAALLNALPIFGIGYLYLDRIGRFLFVFLFQIFSLFPMTILGLGRYNAYLLAIVWVISIFDAISVANKINRQL